MLFIALTWISVCLHMFQMHVKLKADCESCSCSIYQLRPRWWLLLWYGFRFYVEVWNRL